MWIGLDASFCWVYPPHALAMKYTFAVKDRNWQWVFPSLMRSTDPRPDAYTGQLINQAAH